MKILHVDSRPDWRGGQHQILLLMRGLRARGHVAELMAREDSPLALRAASDGFHVHRVSQKFTRAASASRLRTLLGGASPDIVHAHDPHALTAAWLAGAHRRTRLAAARRVAYPLTPGRIALARYRGAHLIVAVSRFVAEGVLAAGIPAQRVAVVYDGVEMPPLGAAIGEEHLRRAARQRFGFAPEEIVLGCVGYLLPEKNQETLVRALTLIRSEFPRVRLLLAGDGPCRAALERTARELGMRDAVVFAGFVEQIDQAYRAMDIFLFPSLEEPLGSSLLAAMSFARPAIAGASGGVPEVLENERNGILLAETSAEAFSAATRRLLADEALAGRLGAAARDTIAARFTAGRMVEETLAAYSRVFEAAARDSG